MALTDSGKVFYWGDAGVGIRASSRSKVCAYCMCQYRVCMAV